MADAVINSVDELINDKRFASLPLPDKNKMLMTFKEFAQHTPQDRQKMLDVIHYKTPNPNQPIPSLTSGGGPIVPGESLAHGVSRQALGGVGRAVKGVVYDLPASVIQEGKDFYNGPPPGEKTGRQIYNETGKYPESEGLQPLDLIKPFYERAKTGDIGAITELASYAFGPEVVGRMSKAAIAKLPVDELAQRIYQRALKPGPGTHTLPEIKNMTQFGVEKGIPISEKGVSKLRGLIDNLNTKINSQIKVGSSKGVNIDPQAVATRTVPTRNTFENQVNPEADVAAIDQSKAEFLKKQGAKPGIGAVPPAPTGLLDQYGKPIMSKGTPAQPPTPAPPMSASEAQSVKVGTYKQLRGKYGELSSAAVEAQKALARGIKEELEGPFPEIKGLNKEESRAIGLDGALERAVNRIGNRNHLSLGSAIAGGAAGTLMGAVSGSTVEGAATAGAIATMYQILSDPVVQSKLAIALSKAGKFGGSVDLAKARIAGYTAALAKAQKDKDSRPPTLEEAGKQ